MVMVMMMITKECLVGGNELFELMMLMEMIVMMLLKRNLS